MGKKQKKRFYAILAVVCLLSFAGCDQIEEFLGFGAKEEPENPLPGENSPPGENPLPEENSPPGENPLPEENPPPEGNPPPIILSFYVSKDGSDDNSGTDIATPFLTLEKAYAEALLNPDRRRIVVLTDLTVTGANEVLLGEKENTTEQPEVTIAGIDGPGSKKTIARDSNKDDTYPVIRIWGGTHVTFENIKIDGKTPGPNNPDRFHRGLVVNGENTQVTLGSGTEITGQTTRKGAGIFVEKNATLVMNTGSLISDCVIDSKYTDGESGGGGVGVEDATFVMNG
jgi:hypothetical protein